MYSGYFNSKDHTVPTERDSGVGFSRRNNMGFAISDSTAVGYYFKGFLVNGHGHVKRRGVRRSIG
jgi:hypothetical protein